MIDYGESDCMIEIGEPEKVLRTKERKMPSKLVLSVWFI